MKMRKTVISLLTAVMICISVFCVNSFAESAPSAIVLDYADVIGSNNAQSISAKAERVAEKTGFNIVIVSTKDIGTPKTDEQTVEYADSTYEQLCGINTDGILLLINCDTKYDYISTSGLCINYFSDARIDSIFDYIWDDLVSGDYAGAASSFVSQVEYYYDSGKANNQHEVLGREVDFGEEQVSGGLFIIFIGLVFGVFAYFAYGSQYKIQPPGTRQYLLENSINYEQHTDVFVGNIVRTIYTPRSSSSSGHSGSHHSSTHHSHSGGRHGGGGRHR